MLNLLSKVTVVQGGASAPSRVPLFVVVGVAVAAAAVVVVPPILAAVGALMAVVMWVVIAAGGVAVAGGVVVAAVCGPRWLAQRREADAVFALIVGQVARNQHLAIQPPPIRVVSERVHLKEES